MRHRKRTAKLGMKSQHRRATLANLVCSLITHNRIRTTITKAKEVRRYADKMVTLAKKASLHNRRQALAFLRHKPAVKKLFAEIGKQHSDRHGGYTRIIRIGQRLGDAAEIAILEWTGTAPAAPEPENAKKKAAKAAPENKSGSSAEPKEEAKKAEGKEKAEAAK